MLAKQIRILRMKAGMSQLQLAEKLNVSSSAVGMYEQGRRIPSVDIMIMMAQIFDVSLDYLIIGAGTCMSSIGEEMRIMQLGCSCRKCCFGCSNLRSEIENIISPVTKEIMED